MKKSFTLPSFAKINWFLRILGKRGDGFHEICTAFQTVSLHDDLSFTESDDLILTCSDASIPLGKENLIVKAADFLAAKHGIKKGAIIHLEKRIPSPGGLGGGSSNAAVALFGLSKLWQLDAKFEDFVEIGKNLGSDVPFFFCGGTALGTGRGTEITPLDDLRENHILIVTPDAAVATAEAFARLNAAHLTNKVSKSILQICRNEAQTLRVEQGKVVNDFEKTVFEIDSEIKRVKDNLLRFESRCALMTGSGASVFAVFETAEKLEYAMNELSSKENKWRLFPAKTVSRSEYKTLFELG